ncbi:MAG: hypothetical protein ACRD44_12640 [Bryobacteraceae bacterium]
MRYVHFEIFKGVVKSWPTLFGEAADFAESLGREKLIGISHSEDASKGVVTVWYWADKPRLNEK